jgi:hypothetical protein
MIYIAYFVHFWSSTNRKTSIHSGYHTDWTSLEKPDFNCASLILSKTDTQSIPGEGVAEALLVPLRSDLWTGVGVGSRLLCLEGEALVRAVFEVPVPPDLIP